MQMKKMSFFGTVPEALQFFKNHDWNAVPYVMVALEAEWCGHCIAFQNAGVFETLNQTSQRVAYISVTVEENENPSPTRSKNFPDTADTTTRGARKELMEALHPAGFPTLVLLSRKRVVGTYQGERTAEDIRQWVLAHIQ